jgi:hypothetical protein
VAAWHCTGAPVHAIRERIKADIAARQLSAAQPQRV